MELEELKKVWETSDKISYSEEEINQVFEIRNKQTVFRLQRYLLKDTLWSVVIAAGFIAILFYFDFANRLGWTIAFIGLALTMVVTTALQSHWLYKSLLFETNIVQSLKLTAKRLYRMKIYSLILPTLMAGTLTTLYLIDFGTGMSLGLRLMWVIAMCGFTATCAYYMTSMTISRYLEMITESIKRLEFHEEA